MMSILWQRWPVFFEKTELFSGVHLFSGGELLSIFLRHAIYPYIHGLRIERRVFFSFSLLIPANGDWGSSGSSNRICVKVVF